MKSPKLPQLNTQIDQLPQDLTIKVWQQFRRDLSKIGNFLDHEEAVSMSVNQMLSEVSATLFHLLSTNEESFWQLLYHVDLPEAYLGNIELTEEGIAECAKIILIREWQKVILRQHFTTS
jgi:hypothetical protein